MSMYFYVRRCGHFAYALQRERNRHGKFRIRVRPCRMASAASNSVRPARDYTSLTTASLLRC